MTPQQKADRLVELARRDFPGPALSKAEERMLRAAATGGWADLRARPGDDFKELTRSEHPDHPANAQDWAPDRTVRAALIRWLCVEDEAKALVDPRGIQVVGARVKGRLDLSCVHVDFSLALVHSSLPEGANLQDARLGLLSLQGSHITYINAERAAIKASVFLKAGFCATGEVRLLGAEIGGDLDCHGGRLENPEGNALFADGAAIKGSAFLNVGFYATGVVRLLGSEIDGDLACRGGRFEGAEVELPDGTRTTIALAADRAKIKGSVFLDKDAGLDAGFRATGEVRLLGTKIIGDLDCHGGRFEGGMVALPDGTRTTIALAADSLHVVGTLFFEEVQSLSGAVRLVHARARVLVDDSTSWPERGRLALNGFTYDAIQGTTNARQRLAWLELQYPADRAKWRDSFRPQPYDQLARVLRQMGHDKEAMKVLIGKHRHQRLYGGMGLLGRAWDWFLGFSIGHGYQVWRLLVAAVILWGLGVLVAWQGHGAGLLVPTCETKGPAFCSWAYAFDVLVPLVNLHQAENWRPDTSKGAHVWPLGRVAWAGWAIQIGAWAWIIAGWFLATLAVAGLTGIVKRE